jgi:hypothetical protein
MSYVTPLELATQIGKVRDVDNPRFQRVCDAATKAIDDRCGRTTSWAGDAIPATIQEVALSLGVDIWKQPDATFGIMGMGETGPVRTARDLVERYDAELIPFYEALTAWGIA